ncbi:MAG: penicillin-binding transpeptidase domain-containing protein, partial [Patescibacteria group bacterium]
TCFEVPGQKPYCPRNYNGGYSGPVTVRHALANSLNIPAVKGLRIINLETFIDQARKMGISSWIDPSNYGLSLTLGGGEVRMIDMAQAFGVLANEGVRVPLTPILKIENYRGEVFEKLDIDERLDTLEYLTDYDDDSKQNDLERVMDRAPAYLASHIMQDNKARTPVFGARSSLVVPDQIVSAKTGTTNDLKDNWTVGFTPEFLVITWVGNNDNTPMNQYLVSGITGAAPIFNDIMSYVLEGREAIWQEKPSDVNSAPVCANGMPPDSANKNCQTRSTELYWQHSQASNSKIITKEVWIKASTGLPPKPGESEDDLQLQQKIIYTDPLTKEYCSDCARATNEEGKVVYERYNVSNEQSSTTND